MSQITRQLAEFASGADCSRLPAEVVERTTALIMDQFGIAVRARHEADLRTGAARSLNRLGLGEGVASVIGDPNGYAPPAAAFFNGNLGHSLDFDDTHARGSIHPSAPIVPAALAAAEMTGASGRDVVAGVTAGYEIQIRLSLALGPSDHYDRGFHPTATCGVFGAAAAAGRVMGLDVDRIADAFGLCGSQAAGSMQWNYGEGSWNKPFHVGYAAMSGLIAATFAYEGFRGASGAIEGEAGFLHAYAPTPDPDKAVEGLGTHWETLGIAVKPYPSCRYGHAAMDALIGLRARHGIEVGEIERVVVGLPATGFKIIGTPDAEKQAPKNYVDGQFSMPFVAAVALSEGGMTWDSYARRLEDPETRALCRKISTVVDPRVEAQFPAHMAGSAKVTTTRGEYEDLVVAAKGEPENFPSAAELRAKFDGLVGPYLDESAREVLSAGLLGLAEADDVRAVMRLSRPAPGARLQAAGGD